MDLLRSAREGTVDRPCLTFKTSGGSENKRGRVAAVMGRWRGVLLTTRPKNLVTPCTLVVANPVRKEY